MRLYQNDASWSSRCGRAPFPTQEQYGLRRQGCAWSPLALEEHQTLLFTIYARIMLPSLAPVSALSVGGIYCVFRLTPWTQLQHCSSRIMTDPVLNDISHRRFNLLRGSWILVSPHRTKRPWQW